MFPRFITDLNVIEQCEFCQNKLLMKGVHVLVSKIHKNEKKQDILFFLKFMVVPTRNLKNIAFNP